MSKKKAPPPPTYERRTPLSSNKRLNLNQTSNIVQGTSRNTARMNLNSTRCGPTLRIPRPMVAPHNSEMNCDFAYNNYLQALMTKKISTDAVCAHKTKCNDQLVIHWKTLSEMKTKAATMERRIKEINDENQLHTDLKELKAVVCASEEVLHKDIVRHIEKFEKMLHGLGKVLHLKNLQPLKNQDDYDEFERLINDAGSVLQHITNIMGDVDGLHKLADGVLVTKTLSVEIVKMNNNVTDMEDEALLETLEKTSKLLARE